VNRRRFLASIGVLIAASFVPVAAPAPVRGVDFCDLNAAVKRIYSEHFESLTYRDSKWLRMLAKR
jgi:hypothetical protein